MKIHDLQPAPGSNKRRKRVGRGIAGKGGKTAGRGTKGQASRGRGKIPLAFEGGQMPLHMRVPKLRGFNNPFRIEYHGVNLDLIEESGLTELDPDVMLANGRSHKNVLVKVLGRGTVSKPITVKAHAFSKSAEEAITSAGGSIEILPKPYGDRRPPAKGNHLTNR